MAKLDDGRFDALFTTSVKSVFRLETLPVYNPVSEGEKFRAYMAGDPCPRVGVVTPYMQRVMDHVAQGIRRYRVHVVRSPLTDYLRYEMEWGYSVNAQAGEEIFILDTAEHGRPEGLLDEDFWFFDETRTVRMIYREDGEYQGSELVENPGPTHYRTQRDLALAEAVPFDQYWSAHPQYHRD